MDYSRNRLQFGVIRMKFVFSARVHTKSIQMYLGDAPFPKDEALLRLRQSLNCNISRVMQNHWAISICPVLEAAASQIQEIVT